MNDLRRRILLGIGTLPLLAHGYVVGPAQRFESDGYAVSAYRLEKRSGDEEAASVTRGDRVDVVPATASVAPPPRTARAARPPRR